MIRFVMAVMALIAIKSIPVPSDVPAQQMQQAEQPAAEEDQPFAMVSAGWLDGAGGFIVTP